MSRTAELMQILLVEDSLADIELTLDALAGGRLANEVTVVRDGASALEYLRSRLGQLPDLIILDLNLPRMNGHEVLAAIRADDKLRRLPVAVLTTSCAEADVARTYEFVHVVQSIDDFWLGLVRLPP
jgi:chemotaxis family two-component system response regulator Rcp1